MGITRMGLQTRWEYLRRIRERFEWATRGEMSPLLL